LNPNTCHPAISVCAQVLIYLMLEELVVISGVRDSLMITGNLTLLCTSMP